MSDFLAAPALSFFSLRFYQRILKSGAGRGFAYLLYLTVLFCFLATFLCHFLLLPVVSGFVDWFINATPEIRITSAGLDTKAPQPFLLKHPAFGPLYLIDTSKSLQELTADKSGAPILIGKEQIVFRYSGRDELRLYELKKVIDQVARTNQPIAITKPVLKTLWERVYRLLVPGALLVFAPIFFLWKLMSALFYSLVALLLNRFRKEKLHYGTLFSLSCFAMTPITVIQWMMISIPELHFNVSMLLSLGLTTAYLAYGLFATSSRAT